MITRDLLFKIKPIICYDGWNKYMTDIIFNQNNNIIYLKISYEYPEILDKYIWELTKGDLITHKIIKSLLLSRDKYQIELALNLI